jgi:hypothetical protein
MGDKRGRKAGAAGLEPVTSAVTGIRPAPQSFIPVIGILLRILLSMKQFVVLRKILRGAGASGNPLRPPNSAQHVFQKTCS